MESLVEAKILKEGSEWAVIKTVKDGKGWFVSGVWRCKTRKEAISYAQKYNWPYTLITNHNV